MQGGGGMMGNNAAMYPGAGNYAASGGMMNQQPAMYAMQDDSNDMKALF